ncbi:MAG: hypothetical protein CMK09_18885 [Ponticaulis sp.]|nr:hypothetical protein [Ponticaulis sp.]|tara:strand:+ start:150205 stop:150384 length:180 start_codon:yes stop_codon:yes gene_type:complete
MSDDQDNRFHAFVRKSATTKRARDAFFNFKGIITHRTPVSAIDDSLDGVIEGISYVIAE